MMIPNYSSPLISVVIPCFRQAQFLTEAVMSVVHQTYKNWECFIINDGSPDDTSSVARQLIAANPRCRIVLLEKASLKHATQQSPALKESGSHRSILTI